MNKIFKKRQIFIVLALLIGLLITPHIYGIELDTVMTGSMVGDATIVSGRGRILYNYTRVDSMGTKARENDQAFLSKFAPEIEAVIPNNETFEINFVFDGPKIKFIEKSTNVFPDGKTYPMHWQWAYNGEKLDLLRLDGLKDGIIVPMGSVRSVNEIPVDKFDPRYNGMSIMGTPVNEFLNGSLGNKAVESLGVVGEETQNGVMCNKIQGNIENSESTVTVWLAPNRMFRPMKIEIASFDTITEIQNSFREHSGGVWFPEQIQKKVFYLNARGEKELYSSETLEIQDSFELNVELTNDEFEIEFPKGME
ncbi:hypothetical protein ACFL50_06355, partial [Candidatus Latescibacterota bacterium]